MDIPGLPARRAALKLLDAVLRRGETLDQAAHNAVQGLGPDSDKALARAIAAEALRWLPDLDALIDSATREPLPEDAKPRSVLRLMLAQWLRLGTPPHAVVATALPLLSGGPKRLAHGVFATLTYSGYAHFDSDEFAGWIAESGFPKDADAYGAARTLLAGARTSAEELTLKTAQLWRRAKSGRLRFFGNFAVSPALRSCNRVLRPRRSASGT